MRYGLFAAVLLFAGCSDPLAKDLENFCRVVNEVDKEASLTNEQKLEKIDARKSEYVHPAEGVPDIWTPLAQLSGEQRHDHLVTAAAAAGKKSWTCNVYKKIAIAALVEQRTREAQEKDKAEKEAKEKAEAEAKAAEQAAKTKQKDSKKKKKKGKRRR